MCISLYIYINCLLSDSFSGFMLTLLLSLWWVLQWMVSVCMGSHQQLSFGRKVLWCVYYNVASGNFFFLTLKSISGHFYVPANMLNFSLVCKSMMYPNALYMTCLTYTWCLCFVLFIISKIYFFQIQRLHFFDDQKLTIDEVCTGMKYQDLCYHLILEIFHIALYSRVLDGSS